MSWTETAINKVWEFTKLEDNWDGEGAEPIPECLADSIECFFEQLKDLDIPNGFVAPYSGGCQIEWKIRKDTTERAMELDFDGFSFFILHWFPTVKSESQHWREDFRTYSFDFSTANIDAVKLLLYSFFVESETLYTINEKYTELTKGTKP